MGDLGAIGSVFEGLLAADVDVLSPDRLADDLVELERLLGLLEAVRLRRLEAFAREGAHHSLGFPSATAFLKHRCGLGGGRAHRLVHQAHTLSSAPHVFSGWTGGRLSSDQTFQLLRVADRAPGEFGSAEETLVGIVEDLSVSDTGRALEYWFQSVDGPGALADEMTQRQRRGLSVSKSFDGMGRVDGDLTGLAHETLTTALDALMPPPGPGETRTSSQRRHDALEDLARYYLDHTDTPMVGGEKPHLTVISDLDGLQGMAGGIHETENGQVLTVAQIRALACDSSVTRIVLDPDSEIIDVGRRTRVIPTALRRAITLRDRHCTWKKGCDRPARWCDIHHDQHWANGGTTSLDNCRLLCRYHHTLTHQLEHKTERHHGATRTWRHPRMIRPMSQLPAVRPPALVRRE